MYSKYIFKFLSVALAFPLAVMRDAHWAWLRWVAATYSWSMRAVR